MVRCAGQRGFFVRLCTPHFVYQREPVSIYRLLKKWFSPRLVKNIRMHGARRMSATQQTGVFQQPADEWN